ncbi:hypothetical protein MRX96_020309 [Rhipicephalus microplus]
MGESDALHVIADSEWFFSSSSSSPANQSGSSSPKVAAAKEEETHVLAVHTTAPEAGADTLPQKDTPRDGPKDTQSSSMLSPGSPSKEAKALPKWSRGSTVRRERGDPDKNSSAGVCPVVEVGVSRYLNRNRSVRG